MRQGKAAEGINIGSINTILENISLDVVPLSRLGTMSILETRITGGVYNK